MVSRFCLDASTRAFLSAAGSAPAATRPLRLFAAALAASGECVAGLPIVTVLFGHRRPVRDQSRKTLVRRAPSPCCIDDWFCDLRRAIARYTHARLIRSRLPTGH